MCCTNGRSVRAYKSGQLKNDNWSVRAKRNSSDAVDVGVTGGSTRRSGTSKP